MTESELKIGDRVTVITLPPYLKTAEPMPMLRPSNLIEVGEEGIVLQRHPSDYWSIRFNKGDFLLDAQYLEVI